MRPSTLLYFGVLVSFWSFGQLRVRCVMKYPYAIRSWIFNELVRTQSLFLTVEKLTYAQFLNVEAQRIKMATQRLQFSVINLNLWRASASPENKCGPEVTEVSTSCYTSGKQNNGRTAKLR